MLLLVTLAGRAHAQSAEAASLFSEGNKLMASGKFAAACDAFEASNRVEPRAGTLIRLGDCREQNHQLASAWSAYKDALGRVKDPRKRAFAAEKIAAFEPRLSYLTIAVSDTGQRADLTVLRDGKPVDPLLWNRALPIDGGDYRIEARAPGFETWRTTVHVAVEGQKLAVQVPRLAESSQPTPTSPAGGLAVTAVPSAPRVPRPAAPEPRAIWSPRRWLAVSTATASVIALGTGAVLGVLADHRKTDAYALCTDLQIACNSADQANALLRSGHNLAIGADVAFGIGAAAAIATGVLWFTGAPESQRGIALVPVASPDRVMVTATRSF